MNGPMTVARVGRNIGNRAPALGQGSGQGSGRLVVIPGKLPVHCRASVEDRTPSFKGIVWRRISSNSSLPRYKALGRVVDSQARSTARPPLVVNATTSKLQGIVSSGVFRLMLSARLPTGTTGRLSLAAVEWREWLGRLYRLQALQTDVREHNCSRRWSDTQFCPMFRRG